MTKELLIASSPHETKVAVLEDAQLVEVYFQRDTDAGVAGGIYKGRVNRVLPGMQSAFVNIGLERDAFLYVSDFFEDSEEYDRVFTEAENRVARLSGDAGPAPADRARGRAETGVSAGLPAAPEKDLPSPPAAPEPREPAAQASPSAAAPQHSAPSGIPAPAGASSQERWERRRHGFGGRHRRRGRPAGDEHVPAPRSSESNREEQPPASQGLQLLPGESVAKYGHSAETGPEPAPEELKPSSAPASVFVDERAGEARAGGGTDLSESADETAAPPHVASDLRGPAPSTQQVLETAEESAEFRQDFEGDSPAAAEPSIFEEEERSPQPGDGQAFDETSQAGGDLGSRTEQAEMIPTQEEEASGHASEAAALESHASKVGEHAAHSYTLRESERRPRVGPQRRGRRGHGRFRPREERPEAASAAPETPGNAVHHPAAISELLKEGQEILVQIAKEPLGAKGARITSHIALPGRYLVYMPTITHIGVSRKIGSEEERLRLRNIILQHRGSLTGGFIVRTAGAGRTEDEFKADLAFLTNLWNDIRAKAERAKAPALLHRDLTLVERILRDLLSPDFKSVRVDSEIEYEHVLDFVHRFQPSLTGHVKLYTREAPLFEEFGVQSEIDKALRPKVWLKSGGYIVINQTEALVAIDVNTGKYVGKTNRLEDTIVKTNIDAVKEIVRQIRLRDLGGIIVIDFIDMDERRNRLKVVQTLEEALRDDRAPTKILAFNEFGLVALTRKRVKQSLERTLCEPCPHCSGAGWIKSVATVSNEIVAEARKMAAEIDGKVLHLRVHPGVAAALKAQDGALTSEIEAATGKEVVIKSDPEAHQERFEIF
ncbi:MAG: Rne/Rng family ribonuclease [Terriglobia bacterium]